MSLPGAPRRRASPRRLGGSVACGMVCAAVLYLLAVSRRSQEPSVEEQLLAWALNEGALVHMRIGRACPSCLRGAVATRTIPRNGLVAKVPLRLAVSLPAGESHEQAYGLLERMHSDPKFNATWGLYVRNWAPAASVWGPELLSKEQVEELQSPFLAARVQRRQDMAWLAFNGTYGVPLNFAIAPASITYDIYKYVVALVSSRKFAYDDDTDLLLPVLDMPNHREPGISNAVWYFDAKHVYVEAKRNIQEGEEITISYQSDLLHRNDLALYQYGFLQDQDPPLLCAEDTPGFNASRGIQETPLTDDLELRTPAVVDAEAQRLRRLLACLPTSLEADERALGSSGTGDWRSALILRYRVLRKRALQLRVQQLAAALTQ